MSTLDWIFTTTFFILYFCLLFTVCLMTFRKGYVLLGILGIVLPILWLIGAILPPKRGSRYEVEQATRFQAQYGEMTR